MLGRGFWVSVLLGAVVCLCSSFVLAQEITLTFLTANPEENYRPVITGFEQRHPEIKIIYQNVPFNDLNAAVEARIARGDTSVDVLAVDTPRVPAFASKGYLLKLDSRAEEIRQTFPNPVDIEHVSYKGEIYAYPMWSSTQMLFYNRRLLQEANVEPPSADPNQRITWAALLEKAKLIQKSGVKWGVMFQQPDRFYQLQPLFESAGAGSGLQGDGLLEPAISGSAWIEIAQWYGDLFAQGLAPRGVGDTQVDDLFINGDLAFLIGGPWVFDRYSRAKDLDYGVALHPYFEGGNPVTATGSWALAINPHSRNIEAAQKFVEFITLDPEGAWLAVSSSSHTPTNPAAFGRFAEKLESLTEKIGPVGEMIGYEMAHTAVSRPRTVGYVAFETIMNTAFSDIRNGARASDALAAAERQLRRQLARLR